jgi:hypothetical protein
MVFLIKGINRHIIEITDTDSAYYERALLVIKPEYASAERELLEKEARKVLKDLGAPSSIKRRSRVFYWLVRLGAAAVLGAAVTALLLLL